VFWEGEEEFLKTTGGSTLQMGGVLRERQGKGMDEREGREKVALTLGIKKFGLREGEGEAETRGCGKKRS